MDWLYPLCGLVVGALVGLTGMGGGSLMTPLIILLFGVHPLTAVGTDLLFAATTKTAGTAIHHKNGNEGGSSIDLDQKYSSIALLLKYILTDAYRAISPPTLTSPVLSARSPDSGLSCSQWLCRAPTATAEAH